MSSSLRVPVVYSTCVFCNSSLGRNESVEHFPVGRRLAFDADKGRLWVVCTQCHRWNLTPFEDRWEGIEDAERAFRSTRLRMSTANIGLARLRDGTDLIRIGQPQRPELAAWRYGAHFTARRRRMLYEGGALVGALGVAALALPALVAPMLIPIGGVGAILFGVSTMAGAGAIFAPRFVKDHSGNYLLVPQDAIQFTRIVSDAQGWGLKVPFVARRPAIVRHATDFINKGAAGEEVLHQQVGPFARSGGETGAGDDHARGAGATRT